LLEHGAQDSGVLAWPFYAIDRCRITIGNAVSDAAEPWRQPSMAPSHFDVIVVGVGTAGASALYHLARRGHKVLGIEQFTAPNAQSSHHGSTRIFRTAYAEDASYVALLQRARDGWLDAEAAAGCQLMHVTGSVHGGPAGCGEYRGALQACVAHGLPYETLTAAQLQRRHPGYRLPEGYEVVWQPDGGFVLAEASIRTFVGLARQAGARVVEQAPVRAWQANEQGVTVQTDGRTYRAARLVFTAGAWTSRLLPPLARSLKVVRQVVGWFDGPVQHFAAKHFPVFTLDSPAGKLFGLPQWQQPGFKIGVHHHRGQVVPPDAPGSSLDEVDVQMLRRAVQLGFRSADGPLLSSSACLYTVTPDEHFAFGVHPQHDNVVIASACSGHGFKFMPLLGEIVADLVESRPAAVPLDLHGLARLWPRAA
jgi:sarcosine oxidase